MHWNLLDCYWLQLKQDIWELSELSLATDEAFGQPIVTKRSNYLIVIGSDAVTSRPQLTNSDQTLELTGLPLATDEGLAP
jgi:hypothetical protein